MDPERDEVYERIPWETLDKRGGERQWLLYAVAGAVTVGALAYSITRNQPAAGPVETVAVSSTMAHVTESSTITAPPATVSAPLVVAEADLYAVEPERLLDRVAAQAEWFAVEFVAVDGSEESRRVLTSLLPAGSPLPEAPEGTQVFVDWSGVAEISQTGPVDYEVGVVIRSLMSTGDGGFTRQAPLLVGVDISLTEDGAPYISGIPSVDQFTAPATSDLALVEVPPDVIAASGTEDRVLGGTRTDDGVWELVVMRAGADGVSRPVSISP